ncbi:hypothetical protein ABB37_07187 [Leptomonas pyrrhocoris]|uniref:Uncharacterized protein n=1 Tax=Leptomonas pyrrhocoris TaxID=157538 RepID=A0A0N0DTE6_LEPPY|nr:hypothetical protein ABB37_07187 [Leptomonas pyrrhocoris]KPA77298.1 hypothetical protein ABB37_07187 [Leptomonas pyrrhocoris]|eukprot:XP_015655737.1 hypothetical protein ABB37_07187 [Leptomonas pyrrhocoris]
MYAMGCADRWVALVDALEGSNDNDTASCSSTERLRQINAATDSNDWETALQLCLLPQSDGHATAQLPWLQRLRKGLTACEAAAKTSSDVPWQGALALWRFAQLHHRGDCDCGGGAAAAADLTREYGRIFQLLASATRWAESLRCFHASPTRYLDGFVVAQVGYALRASSAHLDRAVLDLWATWRCRVGDGVEPREEAVVQLLQAMLHMSSSSSFSAFTQQSASSATLSSSTTASDASCDHEDPVEIASTVQTPAAVVAADVATKLLVAAAASTTSPASKTSQPEGREQNADDARRLPGTRVPLDWRHRRHLVRRLLTDRWAGDWVEALQVAEASEDVSLLRLVAPRVPRSHPSSLYADTVHRLRERGVELTAGDRAALWAMWGNTRARDEGVPRGNASGPHGHESDARRRHCSADVWERGGDVAQIAHAAEFLLVELLGADEEDAPPTQVKTP